MSQRGDSLFHTFATRLAEYVARNSPHREAEYLTWVSVIYAMAADCFGGERVYGPRTNRGERQLVRERITMAIEAGETPDQIAKREGVTPRHVRKLRQRGTIRP
jgi:hypothetical protein